jgi:hypothetical protein
MIMTIMMLLVEPLDVLRLSISEQLRRWGIECLSYPSIAEAHSSSEMPALLQHRILAFIISQPTSSKNAV